MKIHSHFVFDLDDTLTDSHSFNQQLFVNTFLPYIEVTPKVERFLRKIHKVSRGASMHDQFMQAIVGLNLAVDPSTLLAENEKLHISEVHKILLFESTRDILSRLSQEGKHMSICSNRQTASLSKILSNHKINHYFKYVISCHDAGHEKPDPYCLERLIKRSKQAKDEFIYIGDSQTDHDFATNAGIDFKYINHYWNHFINL